MRRCICYRGLRINTQLDLVTSNNNCHLSAHSSVLLGRAWWGLLHSVWQTMSWGSMASTHIGCTLVACPLKWPEQLGACWALFVVSHSGYSSLPPVLLPSLPVFMGPPLQQDGVSGLQTSKGGSCQASWSLGQKLTLCHVLCVMLVNRLKD